MNGLNVDFRGRELIAANLLLMWFKRLEGLIIATSFRITRQ